MSGDLMERPDDREIVGFNFDGMVFCPRDYEGKDKSQPYTYAQAKLDKNLFCAVCNQHLRKVAESK